MPASTDINAHPNALTGSDLEWARDQFARCRPWLQAALDRDLGEFSLDDVWTYVEQGRAQIWPTPNACMISFVEDFPTGVRVLKGWLAGGKLDEIAHTIPKIEAWAKKAGCHFATIGGRRGWVKTLPDYRELFTVIAKDLRDE